MPFPEHTENNSTKERSENLKVQMRQPALTAPPSQGSFTPHYTSTQSVGFQNSQTIQNGQY